MHVSGIHLSLFGASIDRYLIFMYLGIIATILGFTLCRPKDFPFSRWALFLIGIGLGLASFYGAHALHVIINFPRTKAVFFKALITPLGFTYLGAPLLGLAYLWVVSRLRRVSFWVLADLIVPFLMIERMLGRIGCFLWGCCRGVPSGLPWACSWYGGPPSHPTQLYELIYCAGIFAAARYLYRRAAGVRSLAFFFTLFAYSAFRCVNAALRVEGPFMFHSALKWAYPTFFILALIGYAGMAYAFQRAPAEGQTVSPARLMKGAAVRLCVGMVITALVILPAVIFLVHGKIVQ